MQESFDLNFCFEIGLSAFDQTFDSNILNIVLSLNILQQHNYNSVFVIFKYNKHID